MLGKFYHRPIFLMLLMATSSGCNVDPSGGSEPAAEITVTAGITAEIVSKAYQQEGPVENGEYNLTFPSNINDTYTVAKVLFSDTPVGHVTIGTETPLKWSNVGGGSSPTFYLDNLPERFRGTGTTVTFPSDDNPYVAAVYDAENGEGENDLLWGSKPVSRNTGTIHVDLNHVMARVRVEITVDNTNGEIDLSDATVTLTKINQTPKSFNRLDGTLALDLSSDRYTDLVLVDTQQKKGWKTDSDKEDTYYTPDYILPPQELLKGLDRPHLIIKTKGGDTYSGILPSAMLIPDGTHDGEPSYPVELSFLSRYVLTIRTVLTNAPPTLTFMPVYVVNWVDKGTYDLEAHQSGIYTAEEFYKMMEYYNAGNNYQLDRYGKKKDGTWIFGLWHSIVLEYDKINGKMTNNENCGSFSFNYNNYSVSVQNGDAEPTAVDASKLYAILTGQGTL